MKYLLTACLLGLAAATNAIATELVSEEVMTDEARREASVLIRNVSLIDPDDDDKLLTVSLLVVDDVLDVISQDPIPASAAARAFDARNGVLIGRLKLGEPASFMILNGDPRENVDLLLDTKTYATFGMRRGEIVRNQLIRFQEQEDQLGETPSRWLAYSPPPLAVPLDYYDTSKFNRFESKPLSGLFAAAVVLDRAGWVDQNGDSEIQVGDLEEFEGGEIRGFRLGGVGTINFERPWVWTLFGATHAFDKGFDAPEDDEFTWFDVRLDIPIWEKTTFSIGKQKEPISMERLTPLNHLPMQERSAIADAILPARNVGVVMSSMAFNDNVVLAGGVFNNWLDKDQPNSISDNSTAVVGRATWVPFEDPTRSTLFHLGAGYRYSDAKEGGLVRTEPEINSAPDFVTSDLFEADEINTYQFEASMRSGRLWVHGEYLRADVDADELLDPTVEGYHVTAAWSLSGEMREYNRRLGLFRGLPIARTVYQNGWGSLEASARYSRLDANDGLLEAGDMDIWSAGIAWWLTPYFHLSFNYRYITLDKDGLVGTSQGFNSRLALILE